MQNNNGGNESEEMHFSPRPQGITKSGTPVFMMTLEEAEIVISIITAWLHHSANDEEFKFYMEGITVTNKGSQVDINQMDKNEHKVIPDDIHKDDSKFYIREVYRGLIQHRDRLEQYYMKRPILREYAQQLMGMKDDDIAGMKPN